MSNLNSEQVKEMLDDYEKEFVQQEGRVKTETEMNREEDRAENILGNLACGFLSTLLDEGTDFEDVTCLEGSEVNGTTLALHEETFTMLDSQHPGDLTLIFDQFFIPALEQLAEKIDGDGQLVVRPYQDQDVIDFVTHGILSATVKSAGLAVTINQSYTKAVGGKEGFTTIKIQFLSGRVQ